LAADGHYSDDDAAAAAAVAWGAGAGAGHSLDSRLQAVGAHAEDKARRGSDMWGLREILAGGPQ
jgi:hypothetical protein